MFLPDLVILSRRVVTPRGTRPAAIHIRQGKIIGVVAPDDVPAACAMDEVGDAAVLPGVVDTCARLAGDIERTTQAAAAGGVTTVVAVSPAPYGNRGHDSYAVDIGFWGHASAANAGALRAVAESGVLGFVCGRRPRPISESSCRRPPPQRSLMVSDVSDPV